MLRRVYKAGDQRGRPARAHSDIRSGQLRAGELYKSAACATVPLKLKPCPSPSKAYCPQQLSAQQTSLEDSAWRAYLCSEQACVAQREWQRSFFYFALNYTHHATDAAEVT